MVTGAKEAIARAFKECDLDCSQWNMSTLLELASIAIAGLQRSGYQIYEYNPPRKGQPEW